VLAIVLLGLAPAAPATAAPARFETGLQDPLDPGFQDPDPEHALDVARAQGVTTIRVPVAWSTIATTRPEQPLDPDDPAYTWGWLDDRVAAITARGMEPLLVLYAAPAWARPRRGGKAQETPRASTFGPFAAAAARRYDGNGHPRVRLWQIWNEPNLRRYFSKAKAPQRYRALLNAAYGPIHAAAPGNVVVAGGLGPLGDPSGKNSVAPMRFMRGMLCMSRGPRPRATCSARSSFDVWSHNPYTSGGPNRHATSPDDVFVADLPEMRSLLDAARRARHVRSAGNPRFWVTEFSWDSSPPDPGGLPLRTHARWAAEAFYRMWTSGVSLVSWFELRDAPKGGDWGSTFQGGLFQRTVQPYAREREKPVARVLRFPFVAVPDDRRVALWGRTPDSRPHPVVVERRADGRWRRVAVLRAGAHGVFHARRSGLRGALMRARVGSSAALPFRAVKTRARWVAPFGGK
jgi:hypothetical protein